ARVERRGAPGIRYYEEMGATGYRLAADTVDAENWGLDHLYRTFADNFPALRIALNRIADRHPFPMRGDPIDRLLRQIADRFHDQSQHRMNYRLRGRNPVPTGRVPAAITLTAAVLGRSSTHGHPRPRHHRAHPAAPGPGVVPGSRLGGHVRGLPGAGAREPAGRAQRVPAPLRHDHLFRHSEVYRVQEGDHALQLLRRPDRRREGRGLRAGRAAHEARAGPEGG